jgi:hypothetical protein
MLNLPNEQIELHLRYQDGCLLVVGWSGMSLYQGDRSRNEGLQNLPNEPNVNRIFKHFNVGK